MEDEGNTIKQLNLKKVCSAGMHAGTSLGYPFPLKSAVGIKLRHTNFHKYYMNINKKKKKKLNKHNNSQFLEAK